MKCSLLIVAFAVLTTGQVFQIPLACAQCKPVQAAKLVDEGTIRLGEFAVAVRGTVAVVGQKDDSDYDFQSGSVYIFDTKTGEPIVELHANDPVFGGQFGRSLAITDGVAIIGSHGAHNNNGETFAGAVYLFDTTSHQQIAKLLAEDSQDDDVLGISVAVSGNTLIAGAPGVDDNGSRSGAAYLFDITTGQQLAKLLPNDGETEDEFGASRCVGIAGSVAIVGAPDDDNENGVDAGAAYLFDVTTGQQLAKLLPDDGAAGDSFGFCAVQGNLAIVTSVYDDDNGNNSGSAYLFDITSGQQLTKLLPDDGAAGDLFGTGLSISGDIAVIGAQQHDDNGTNSGAAYLFDIKTGQQLAKLLPDDGSSNDFFGKSVFISGDVVIAGAPLNNESAGAAYLFNISDCLLTLGDVNGDGVFNLLDVQPFVVLLQNSGYLPEADINQDGVVNLLDVQPFVELLSGG